MCRRRNNQCSLYKNFLKVCWPCFLWGTGTALGEIPPYAISRAARLAGIANKEFEEIQEAHSKWTFLGSMKVWMINFLQKHGFIGVILMSAWPNAAFDLCGICCGHFLMPFWKFLAATFIGKALIKINLQACFFITLFTEEHLANLIGAIERIIPDSLDPCVTIVGKECHTIINNTLHDARNNFHQNSLNARDDASLLKIVWNSVIFIFIGYFVVSFIEQFAQAHSAKLDKEKNKNK